MLTARPTRSHSASRQIETSLSSAHTSRHGAWRPAGWTATLCCRRPISFRSLPFAHKRAKLLNYISILRLRLTRNGTPRHFAAAAPITGCCSCCRPAARLATSKDAGRFERQRSEGDRGASPPAPVGRAADNKSGPRTMTLIATIHLAEWACLLVLSISIIVPMYRARSVIARTHLRRCRSASIDQIANEIDRPPDYRHWPPARPRVGVAACAGEKKLILLLSLTASWLHLRPLLLLFNNRTRRASGLSSSPPPP